MLKDSQWHGLRWLVLLLLSLLWATMGSGAPLAERIDFGHCALAAMTPLERARAARNQLAAQSGDEVATVTGGYNTRTGQVTAKGTQGDGNCAEHNVAATLGNNKAEIKFTEATRPRTGEEVPVCTKCETRFGREKFPEGTQFKTDERKR